MNATVLEMADRWHFFVAKYMVDKQRVNMKTNAERAIQEYGVNTESKAA